MHKKALLEKFRNLSTTALITGILADSLACLYLILSLTNFIRIPIEDISTYIIGISLFITIIICLAITAIVSGSIDLKRIRAGQYTKKGRGFDIAGIVLGAIIVLIALFFVLEEIIGPFLLSFTGYF